MVKRSFKEKLKNEYIGRSFASLSGILIIIITLSIILFITSKGIQTFTKDGYSLSEFLFSSNWKPFESTPSFGALAFILGSTMVSAGAIVISAPVAVSLGIFVNVISKGIGNKVIKPALEILVGIPSVVYGWVGVTVLVPFLRDRFGGIGFSLLAGILVLALMTLPTIATISMDAIKGIPMEHIEASYGLGATRWQTIKNVIVPGAKSGILTAVVLGVARAFGEALAVQMVIGNAVKIPGSLTESASTLTSVLTMDMANTVSGTPWNNALWTLALILLGISFTFIIVIRAIEKRSGV